MPTSFQDWATPGTGCLAPNSKQGERHISGRYRQDAGFAVNGYLILDIRER
jgi:hypothetical protein